MVLKIVGAAANAFFPSQYLIHIVVGVVIVLVLRAFSQGKRTDRERDLHARTIIVTGAFTPLGLTLLNDLAKRGAHIIALSPYPIDSPQVTIFITLLRTTTSNEHIFAEYCPVTSPSKIRAFCTKFLTGDETRVDGIVFAHEYSGVGTANFVKDGPLGIMARLGGVRRKGRREEEDEKEKKMREANSLATFLLTTLLLPALLVAPAERDIRIVTVVNPFYAAAISSPTSLASPKSPSTPSLFLQEGTRSLRTILFTRHLQRILDALPSSSAPAPPTHIDVGAVPVPRKNAQKSNIIAVSVSPGISRSDTVVPYLDADWTRDGGYSWFGVFLYIILQPFLQIFSKSSIAAVQSVLHVLFLPTPYKILAQTAFQSTPSSSSKPNKPEEEKDVTTSSSNPKVLEKLVPVEALKPGALYAECSVVNLPVPPPAPGTYVSQEEDGEEQGVGASKNDGKGKASDMAADKEKEKEPILIEDDGEYGGELAGRLVWEAYEAALKAWEQAEVVVPDDKEEENRKKDEADKKEKVEPKGAYD